MSGELTWYEKCLGAWVCACGRAPEYEGRCLCGRWVPNVEEAGTDGG